MADPYTDINITPKNEVQPVQQSVANMNPGTGLPESEGETQSFQQAGMPPLDHRTPPVEIRPDTETARQSSVHVNQRERVAVPSTLPSLIETRNICGNVGHMAVSCALNQPPYVYRQPNILPAVGHVRQTEPYHRALTNIRPQQPSKFAGDVGEDVAAWTRDVIKYLQLCNVLREEVPAHQQILYASQFLTGDARNLDDHRAMHHGHFAQQTLFQWLAVVEEHFGLAVSAYTLRVEFLSCTQGNDSLEAIRQTDQGPSYRFTN
jgi:hypothetical protein